MELQDSSGLEADGMATSCGQGLAVAAAATASARSSGPSGPTCMAEVFSWADYYLDRAREHDCWQHLVAKAEKGINLFTD
eukprot:12021382-Alexandrium_andersonii.AAC.1